MHAMQPCCFVATQVKVTRMLMHAVQVIISVGFSNLELALILLTETAPDGLRTERINVRTGVHYRRSQTCCSGVNDLICPGFDSVREPHVGDWSRHRCLLIPLHRLIRPDFLIIAVHHLHKPLWVYLFLSHALLLEMLKSELSVRLCHFRMSSLLLHCLGVVEIRQS